MTSKEFDLMISFILELLKAGETKKVIKLLEEAKDNPNQNSGDKNNKSEEK